jgi:2-polyprenyl-3-methyl-5-hydroxy-6-metoxy-1,4-benzoquinol methylase
MENYWDKRFTKERFIWGVEPSGIAKITEKLFSEHDIKTVLIIGIGYGRNGKYFIEKGYEVTGIEISDEAIRIGKTFEPKINFIKGSALNMKLNKKYDAVFCYDVIHLFKKEEREIILEKCIEHCKSDGLIMISCFSDKDKTYGTGKKVEENTYEVKEGKIVHFYAKEEMEKIHKELSLIKIGNTIENIETENRKEEYNITYGIYKIRKWTCSTTRLVVLQVSQI